MSKEVMAECLEEATRCWHGNAVGETTETLLTSSLALREDKLAIATIAAALYQERMRHKEPVESNISPTRYRW